MSKRPLFAPTRSLILLIPMTLAFSLLWLFFQTRFATAQTEPPSFDTFSMSTESVWEAAETLAQSV